MDREGPHFVELDGTRIYFETAEDAYVFNKNWNVDALGVDWNAA